MSVGMFLQPRNSLPWPDLRHRTLARCDAGRTRVYQEWSEYFL